MMAVLDQNRFDSRRWDLSDGSKRWWDVRNASVASIAAYQNPLSANTWNTTITLYWSNGISDVPQALGLTLTAGAPALDSIDVSTIGFIWFDCVHPATSQLVDLSGFAKA